MARIAGVDLPPNKQVWVGLTYIHGIGVSRAQTILESAGVDSAVKVKDLTEDEARKIRKVVQDEGRVEGDLRKEVVQNVRRLMEIVPVIEWVNTPYEKPPLKSNIMELFRNSGIVAPQCPASAHRSQNSQSSNPDRLLVS